MLWLGPLLRHLRSVQAEIIVLDGSGVHFFAWSHQLTVALQTADLAPMVARITAERERRTTALLDLGQLEWTPESTLPLRVVIIDSMTLLAAALGAEALQRWLAIELVASFVVGVRFILMDVDRAHIPENCRAHIEVWLPTDPPSWLERYSRSRP